MRLKNFILLIMFFAGITNAIAQNSCATALPFSTGTVYNFPAGVNAPAAPPAGDPGPKYGCLGSEPNPAWYYLKVCTPGNIEIYMYGTNNHDVDFACWGPFTSPTSPCLLGLTAGSPTPTHSVAGPSANYPSANMIDCSYDAQFQEWCYIPNAIVGKYYILLITNYSNQAQNINFSQSNAGQPGAGSTSGVILPPNISNNGSICAGDTLKLYADSIPNVQYLWSGPNNWTSFVRNPKIPNATAANSGTYYLLVSGCGDVSSENQTIVVVKPKPHVIVTSDTICIGDTAMITASGANTYIWTPGNLTTASLKLTPGVTTTYRVIGNSLGCKDTANTIIKVNTNPNVTVNNSAVCPKDSTTLIAGGALTYIWSHGLIGDSIRVSPSHDTVYRVIGTDVNKCVDTAFSSVIVYPLPVIQLTDNTTICMGSQATLTASGGVSYLWNTIPNETTASITVSPTALLTTYTVGVTDINNCFDSASVDVSTIQLPLPVLALESDTICKGVLTTITASGGSSYFWNTGEITPSISVMPLATTTYSVTISNLLNNIVCSKNIAVQQNVRNCNVIYVPNSFSPTGYNTVFKPFGDMVITKTYQFTVYNRWGQMLFETTNINQGWDGRFNGEYVPSGVYIYYLRIDNGYEEAYEKIGTVTVVE